MQLISYLFFRAMVFLFSLFSYKVLYLISDGLKFLFFNVIKYRYKVIKENLEKAFPEKEEEEIKSLIEASYQNLCDILLEGIKGMSMTDAENTKRYKFINPELPDHFYDNGQCIVGTAAHYGNWEWAVQAINNQLKGITVGVVARIKNKYMDRYVQKYRTHENVMVLYPDIARPIIEKWDKRPAIFIYIADQSPPRGSEQKAHWVNFLNQDTACLWGADNLARRMNFPVLNFAINRVKRGYYEVTTEVISEHPKELSEGEVTKAFMRKLEQQIISKPSDWLWSHKRWKLKR